MDKNIGKKLDGRYEITELIGVGGMAEVYKGVDVIDNKTVAIKILKKEYAENEEFLRRFRNESKAIAVLSHPNIVKIYDVGFSEKIQYIVMEYIDGITLKEYIEEEKVLTWKDTVHFVIQILRALQHAHDKGIVHRDIKPQNIMMFTDGTIKVMDFGIAKFAREEGKTATDQAIGSVHYISPEQASGNVTDAKSDIYSVGAMMYEMLAGRKPFDSDNPVAIAVMHMHDIPERPRAINPDIPDGLEEIVLRAMEKKPDDRYPSTADMIADIEKFKANPSISFGYYQEEDDTSAEDTINFGAPVNNETYPEVADSNDSAFAPAGAAVAAGVGAAAYAGASAAQRYGAPAPQKPITYKDYYDDEDDDDEDEERSSLVIPVLTAVVVVVIIVAVIFVATMLSNLLKGDKAKNDYKMNDFIGMDYNTAQSKYGNNIKFEVEGYEFNPADENTIIWQSIDPDSEYKKGDTLKVKLSKGQEKTTVPDIVDMNQALAEDQLTLKGLKAEIITQSDPVIKENNVIKTEPKAGEEVHKGDTILVYVSMGANTEQIEVESYVGMDAKDAVAIAQYKGLKVKTDTKDSYEDEGKVVEQSIAKGEKVEQGTEIILYISTGVSPDGEIPFTVNFPVDANGRFVIDFILKGDDNKTSTISSPNLIVPEMPSWTQDIKGSGENVLVTVKLTNLNSGAIATIGTYYFNFATGGVTVLSEDVDYAFMLVGGFPEPEEEPTTEEPPVEEPPVEEPPVEEPPVVTEPPVEEPQPGYVPGVDGEYDLSTGEWVPYAPGVNGDWVTQDTGETIWVWY